MMLLQQMLYGDMGLNIFLIEIGSDHVQMDIMYQVNQNGTDFLITGRYGQTDQHPRQISKRTL